MVISHVSTEDIIADFLTKPVTVQKLEQFKAYVGLDAAARTEIVALEPATQVNEVCAVWESTEQLVPDHPVEREDYSFLNVILLLAAVGLYYIARELVQCIWARQRRQRRALARATDTYPTATPHNRARAAMQ